MSPVEEIKSKLSIQEVVSQYLRLEKMGSQYKARCPFHNEKTPSFYVSPMRHSFHCFGCGESGDIFSFVQKVEHIEFRDALKILADRAGVTLNDGSREENSNLLKIIALAKNHYIKNLHESINAKKYAHDRGLSDESLKTFEIGYAKKEWQDLYSILKKSNFEDSDIVLSGMVIKTEEGKIYDRFRGRLIFPIRNISAATVGFTARILPEYDDGKSGKYVNSPETSLYHKSRILFNYDLAKKHIADTREVILVEGQMDAVMSYKAGVQNVIAVSGTAFTEDHVKMIGRIADEVVLCFDNDQAGQKAAKRAAIMCAYGGLRVSFIDIQSKDPADIVARDPAEWVMLSKKKIDIINYYTNIIIKLDDEQKIKHIRENLVPYLKGIDSPLEKNFAIQKCARILNLEEKILKDEIDRYVPTENYYNLKEVTSDVSDVDKLKPESKPILKRNKDDVLLDIEALNKKFKGESDFNYEFPDEIIEKRIIELERKELLKIEFFEIFKKELGKFNLDDELKTLKVKSEKTDEDLMRMAEISRLQRAF